MSYLDLHTFFCPAFVQDPLPPLEDPWAFQTPNLLPWDNIWPHPTSAPPCGGNWRMPGCSQFSFSNMSQLVEEMFNMQAKWSVCFFLSRWFWSWERDRTEPPKLDEASLCPCSLSKASTTTRSSALPPHRTHSWTPAHKLTQLHRSLARQAHCSLLRKKAHAEKCLCDRTLSYSMVTYTLKVKAYMYVFLQSYSPSGVVRLLKCLMS